jgi:hypothetical protein
MRPRHWAAYIAAGVAIDIYAAYVRHDGTLSHAIRETFRTNTPAGRATFLALLGAGVVWFGPHICIWPADRLIKEIS